MKQILDKAAIYAWDQYTIQNEPIKSDDLMWRASSSFCKIFQSLNFNEDIPIHIFCGSGNNGGDGVAIGLILDKAFRNIHIHLLPIGVQSRDLSIMIEKLKKASHIELHEYNAHEISTYPIPNNVIIIDAIFGMGLSKPIKPPWSHLINNLNNAQSKIVAVDNPSGLMLDQISTGAIIKASHTITFQSPKLCQLIPENNIYTGQLHIADIGLHQDYIPEKVDARFIELADVSTILKPRKNFDHKGTYGHAALVTGSFGMMGAAVLSAQACLRSGVGKLTTHVPECGIQIMQTSVPEAMTQSNGELNMTWHPEPGDYDSIGIGCGIGLDPDTKESLFKFLTKLKCPVVIDADGLNLIADKDQIALIPQNSIITPHLKEFDNLFGPHENQFERFKTAKSVAIQYNIIIVLKGAYTSIIDYQGNHFINSTGNPGLATAGSGDVLTGIITGLLAQGYSLFSCSNDWRLSSRTGWRYCCKKY